VSFTPVTTVRLPVRWKEHDDLSALLGQQIVFHFQVNEASLYSFRFGEA